MAVETGEFVGEMTRRGNARRRRISQTELAEALGKPQSVVSAQLRCPALPDEYIEALDRIAPVGVGEGALSPRERENAAGVA